MNLPTEVLIELCKQWGAAFIVGAFGYYSLKLFLNYVSKKNGKSVEITGNREIVDQLVSLNNNHLKEILGSINKGNEKIVDALHENAKILTKIDTKLDKK
jgi:hypothetical protein